MRSTKSRIRASITAGLALSAVGLLSVTGGTVAQLTDTISAKVDLAVAGTPYGIARTVSLGFNYKKTNGNQTIRDRSATVNSLSEARNNAPSEPNVPWTYTDTGIRLHGLINGNGCASSNFDGNTNRCFRTESGSIVSASTGQAPEDGDFEIDFRDENLNWGIYKQELLIHDIQTSVSCFPNGEVSAGQPSAAYWVGGSGASSEDSGWRGFPAANQYQRIRQWMHTVSGQNQAMTVEVQSIRQTFQNPPRALSAVVMYVTSSNARNGGGIVGDFSFVSKSECAVSPDGTVSLDPSETFGTLVPSVRRLETPGWGGAYTTVLSEGPIPNDGLSTTSEHILGDSRSLLGATDDIEIIESGELLAEDTLTTATPETAEQAATSPSSSTNPTSAPTTVSTRASTSPTPKAIQTTTSGGPTPSTSVSTSEPATTGYATDTGQSYASATGATLTRSQRELVEEAIAAAQTTESGELTDGASYATTSNQVDGATLIVKTADGGTLRIVWEK